MSKTCTVLCKLPNGLVIESGYTIKNGSVARLPSYKRVLLKGANQTRIQSGNPNSPFHFTPGVTESVDEDFFDKWCADHKDSTLVENKLIWKQEGDRASVAAAVLDHTQRPMGMEPRDPSKHENLIKTLEENA